MKKKKGWVSLAIILVVIIIAIIIINKPHPETSKEVAECIGKNSKLYVQLGCHACESQEELFGDSYQYLNVIDCFYERDKCEGITGTPTWVIKGEKYEEVLSISILQELTGCQ